jgi:hypothetical protein
MRRRSLERLMRQKARRGEKRGENEEPLERFEKRKDEKGRDS